MSEGAAAPRVGVAVPAAGSGRRMGGLRKPFLELRGEPILLHALRPFLADRRVVAVAVALGREEAAEPPAWLLDLDDRVTVVEGGASRAESVRAAIAALPDDVSVIAVHDAARPLVGRDVVAACIEVAAGGEGAVAGCPAMDTIKEVDDEGWIVGTADRSRLWLAQTPQVFPAAVVRRAYADPDPAATDDAALVERLGGRIRMVDAGPSNMKVTRPGDVALAEAYLAGVEEDAAPDAIAGAGGAVRIDLRADPDADLSAVVAHLRRGGVVAYPTETVYGLGGACTEAGVRRVRMLKKRGAGKPLIALVESREAIAGLEWTESARVLADVFWPGALTLVLRDPHHLFPEGVRDEASGTVGVRVSPHPLAGRLVRALGAPLTSTSLNPPGDAPAASGEEAARLVRALGGGDVWILDAGTLPPSGPSTVVDCTGPEPVVIREGTVPLDRLRCAIPEIHARS